VKTGYVSELRTGLPETVAPAPVRFRRRAKLGVLLVIGTRPELIKLLPVIREAQRRSLIDLRIVLTSQHTDLLRPLIDLWRVPVHADLGVMVEGQSLNALTARVISRVDDVLSDVAPDVVLVQGDTTTAFGTAVAAWQRGVPVAHVEAGLRTADIASPFPEEANRRLISQVAALHFAPTQRNAALLVAEGHPASTVICTGNPIVDAIGLIRDSQPASDPVRRLLDALSDQRIMVLTTHRRESFGPVLDQRLKVLREFVEARRDISVIFPVHPNPKVRDAVDRELQGARGFHLIPPLSYPDFLHCLAQSWAIVSDSGGIQEEAPSLGKPLLILRSETERPEAVECGVARLVGQSAAHLKAALEELDKPGSWAAGVDQIANPFGDGDSARRILNALLSWHERARSETGEGRLT